MAEGWIKLYRNILSHWAWEEKPFSRGQAWIDLILFANHAPRKISVDGHPVVVERGENYTSELFLSTRWGWSRKKVHQFLDRLVMDEMLAVKRHSKGTVLNIVNYNVWQDDSTTEEHQKNIKSTSEEHQKHTNKNDKNIKKIYMETSWTNPDAIGHGQHVRLTPDEWKTMTIELGEQRANHMVDRLNGYIEQIGLAEAKKKYKSHKATLMNWHRKDVETGKYVEKSERANHGYEDWSGTGSNRDTPG